MNIELNTMNLESVSMQAELIKTKQKLEEMVEERTRDLLKSNVTLRTQIHEREKVEKELEQRAIELTMVNNDLRQFAYVASHDMREPVRMITNYVHLLKKRYCDSLDQQAIEYIDYAYNGAKKIHSLMRDIQKYATIGEKATNSEETDLSEVISIVKSKLNYADKDKFFTILHDSLPIVKAARFHMIELFFNLVDNSIKFCEHDHAEIDIKVQETGRNFQFSIEDNGIGIDGEYADKVFNIFQRLDRNNNYMGSGIGLSICKRIVEGYKGKIWYESNVKGGTTFHFTLPKYHMLAKVS